MAGHVARRIAQNRRFLAAMGLLAISGFAHAGWENSRFCRLSDDRLLLIGGNQRFVLTHAAAWELADPTQKDSFAKWLNQSKLPKDLGQLIANAPADHQVPLAGELDASSDSSGNIVLVFKQGGTPSKPIKVVPTADGASPDAEGTTEFEQVAKALGKPASTLLVALADKSGHVSSNAAWSAFLSRLNKKSEFFSYIDKAQGLLWVRHADAPLTTSTPSTATPETDTVPKEKPAGSKPTGDSSDPLVFAVVGVVALVVGGGLGVLIGGRSRKPEVPEPPATPKFHASANEIELVEKARDEIHKLKWPPERAPAAEEVVVGQMIDRFNRFPALQEEVEKLRSYQQFKEAHDLFQGQIDKAVSESKLSHRKSEELAALLQLERSKLDKSTGELQLTRDRLSIANSELQKATVRIADLELSNQGFQQIYAELMNRTAAVCHDLVLTRPRGDNWALAFVYLVDYTLAYLGLARQCNDQRVFDAMVTNLARLADAMSRSFPDRKLVIDPWQRAVKAFGEIKPPPYDQKPHPHVDSLSQILLTVRETGPSLGDFREFYAPSESGLHIIRPA